MAEPDWLEAVRRALAEDRATEDVTTRLLGPAAERPAEARFIAEAVCVIAGLPVAASVFHDLDRQSELETAPGIADGSRVVTGTVFATVRGRAGALLAGERVALNFLQRLSGVATLTRVAVDAVAGTRAKITHTRKTTPGLRALEQYAVRIGGGVDNRASLADAVLWKDNHWALLARDGHRSLAEVLRLSSGVPVIVEVENETQLQAALAAGVPHLLIDNQPPEQVAAWARRAGPAVTIQASGGITAGNARDYALAGAKLIAIGALTHFAPAIPIRCEIS